MKPGDPDGELLFFVVLPALVAVGIAAYLIATDSMDWRAVLVGALFAAPLVFFGGRR